jgi:hypothetical protein
VVSGGLRFRTEKKTTVDSGVVILKWGRGSRGTLAPYLWSPVPNRGKERIFSEPEYLIKGFPEPSSPYLPAPVPNRRKKIFSEPRRLD